MKKPLCIDLFCGLGGWADGFLAEGYDVVGFDIERHDYGTGGYPGQLVLQDVLTLHGSQFRNAAVIVASPPCTEFSYRGRYGRKKNLPPPDTRLFNACFRIAAEANVSVVVENVVWAQEFVGRARTHWAGFYLWGDVPPILPYRKAGEGYKGDHAGLRSRSAGRRSTKRKAMTAELAKIPFPLAQHIARVFKPSNAPTSDPVADQHARDVERCRKELETMNTGPCWLLAMNYADWHAELHLLSGLGPGEESGTRGERA